ncbi:hypothetical protein ACF0H5_010747 [Mactra antiquata]
MSVAKVYDTYSVFVGHIPSGTQKHELKELFQACGEIVDVVILNNGHAPHPIYGFVRFREPSAVYRAIAELHGWKLNGVKLVVEVAQDTCAKIQQENAGVPVTVVDGAPRNCSTSNTAKPWRVKPVSDGSSYNAMYQSRLLDSCTSMNLLNDKDPLSRNSLTILEDMGKVRAEKCPLLWASIDNAAVSFSDVSSKIMERCKESKVNGEPLGKKNSAAFMAALKTIMKEINAFIESNSGEKLENNENIETLSEEDTLLSEFSKHMELGSKTEDCLRLPNHVPDNNFKFKIDDIENAVKRDVELNENSLSDSESDRDNSVYSKHLNLPTVASDVVRKKNSDKKTHENVPELYSSSSDENALSNIDSAVIDYHLSKSCEINLTGASEKSGNSPLEKLFHKNQAEFNGGFKRNESFDSNTSTSSFEGHIDDSGVESDCLRSKGHLSSYQELREVNRMIGRGIVAQPTSPQESSVSSNYNPFSLDEYVLRNKIRGRGRAILTHCKLPTVGK